MINGRSDCSVSTFLGRATPQFSYRSGLEWQHLSNLWKNGGIA